MTITYSYKVLLEEKTNPRWDQEELIDQHFEDIAEELSYALDRSDDYSEFLVLCDFLGLEEKDLVDSYTFDGQVCEKSFRDQLNILLGDVVRDYTTVRVDGDVLHCTSTQ